MIARGPTYRDLIERGARAHRGRVAMIVDGQSHSFADVDNRANRLANALITAGATKGTRIAVLLNNGPDSIPVDFALCKAGLNKVPLNARLSLDEHARMVGEARCDMLLFGADLSGRAGELAEALPTLRTFGLGAALPAGSDLGQLAEQADAAAPDVELSHDDVMITREASMLRYGSNISKAGRPGCLCDRRS